MRLRLDSSGPIFARACSFGTSGAPPPPPLVPPLLPPPHPASSTAVATATAPSAVLRRRPMTFSPSHRLVSRGGRLIPCPRPGAPVPRGGACPPARRQRSAPPPRTQVRRRGRRHS